MNKLWFFFAGIMLWGNSCDTNPYQQGKRLYIAQCSNCHMPDGSGLKGNIPALSASLKSVEINDQVCYILNGINADSLGVAMNVMPKFEKLTPVELTNIINYINQEWNTPFQEISMAKVSTLSEACKK